MVRKYWPFHPSAGVPLMVAVPSAFAVNVTPDGSELVLVMVGKGVPDVVTLNENAVPTVAVEVAGLVNFSGAWTVSVKACVVEPAEFAAVKVSDVVPATVGLPERVA